MVKRTRLLCIALLLIPLLRVGLGTATANLKAQLDSLLAKITLAEKLGQLQQLDGLPDGAYRPEHPDRIRKGLLGSTLNVRGARRTNELQRIAVEQPQFLNKVQKLDAVSETTLNFVVGCRTICKRMTNDLTIAIMNRYPSRMGNC